MQAAISTEQMAFQRMMAFVGDIYREEQDMEQNSYEDIYDALQKLDKTSYEHSKQVMKMAEEVEEYLGIEDKILSKSAEFHDIGKIYISRNILSKVPVLTETERKILDLHPYFGYCILKDFNMAEEIQLTVLYHHSENPPALGPIPPCKNELIMERAKMLHTIDAFMGLTSDRNWREAFLPEEAIHILECEETHHHKGVIDFLNAIIND